MNDNGSPSHTGIRLSVTDGSSVNTGLFGTVNGGTTNLGSSYNVGSPFNPLTNSRNAAFTATVAGNPTRNYGAALYLIGTLGNFNYAIDAEVLSNGGPNTFNYGTFNFVNGSGDGINVGARSRVFNSTTNNIAFSGQAASSQGNNYGVWAESSNSPDTNISVYGFHGTTPLGAMNLAGLFDGDVLITGDLNVTGNLSKGGGTFKIDHPTDPGNKYLVHSFVESPEMMNVYNGNITTDAQGFATVELPDYFEVANKDFRYQLTVIGTFAQAIVKEKIANNQFVIQTNQPNVEVSWQVTGIRDDAWSNANRVIPEQEKLGKEKGTYLHPELYGKPDSAKTYKTPRVKNNDGSALNVD
jgi:hypothetical protein